MSTNELRVGLIGLGTVGSAFLKILRTRTDAIRDRTGTILKVASIAVARPHIPRPLAADVPVHGSGATIALDPDIPLVVEASGAPEAGQWIASVLSRGGVAITANKQALAKSPLLLRTLAQHHPNLHCEAAVASALPILRTLRDSLSCDRVHQLRGILNGTTNFVLSNLEHTESFEEVVRKAQLAGFAEADPSADLSGADAAAKLAILTTIAWREPVPISCIRVQGIDSGVKQQVQKAKQEGRRVRLVAKAWRNGHIAASVRPEALPEQDPLATATGVENIVQLETELAGILSWRGLGAGGIPTASALLSDVLAAVRTFKRPARRSDDA